MPTGGRLPDTVITLCGTTFAREEAEGVRGRTGVPCTTCYMRFLSPRGQAAAVRGSAWHEW